jgi:hypothetical protein
MSRAIVSGSYDEHEGTRRPSSSGGLRDPERVAEYEDGVVEGRVVSRIPVAGRRPPSRRHPIRGVMRLRRD